MGVMIEQAKRCHHCHVGLLGSVLAHTGPEARGSVTQEVVRKGPMTLKSLKIYFKQIGSK